MRVQIVTLTLADGRKVSALFPAFVEDDGERVAVRDIQVQPAFDDPTVSPLDALTKHCTPRPKQWDANDEDDE